MWSRFRVTKQEMRSWHKSRAASFKNASHEKVSVALDLRKNRRRILSSLHNARTRSGVLLLSSPNQVIPRGEPLQFQAAVPKNLAIQSMQTLELRYRYVSQ
jgi:hypothetical protein